MKTFLSILFLGLITFSCALEQASPSDYNDAIFREQMKIKDLLTQLAKSPKEDNQAEIVQKLKLQSSESLKRVEEIGGFRGDKQLYEAAINMFQFYEDLAHNGLDGDSGQISSKLDKWQPIIAEEEHKFFKAQAKFAESYELFL